MQTATHDHIQNSESSESNVNSPASGIKSITNINRNIKSPSTNHVCQNISQNEVENKVSSNKPLPEKEVFSGSTEAYERIMEILRNESNPRQLRKGVDARERDESSIDEDDSSLSPKLDSSSRHNRTTNAVADVL